MIYVIISFFKFLCVSFPIWITMNEIKVIYLTTTFLGKEKKEIRRAKTDLNAVYNPS